MILRVVNEGTLPVLILEGDGLSGYALIGERGVLHAAAFAG